MNYNVDTAAQVRHIRQLDELYIVNHADQLEQWQKQELLFLIAQVNTQCLKQSGDGTRLNISILSPYILKRIKLYISNQLEYNGFFADTV